MSEANSRLSSAMVYFTEMVVETQMLLRTRNILGVRIHDCDEDGAVRAIQGFLAARPARLHQVCTVNPEFVMEARGNPAFRRLLNSVDLATPDGVGIILAG